MFVPISYPDLLCTSDSFEEDRGHSATRKDISPKKRAFKVGHWWHDIN